MFPRTPIIRFDSSLNSALGPAWGKPLSVPSLVLRASSSGKAQLFEGGREARAWNDPLEALAWTSTHYPAAGRWAGFLSYDLGRRFEKIPTRATDDLELPLFVFTYHGAEPGSYEDRGPAAAPLCDARLSDGLHSTFTREAYIASVARAIEYIRAGDIFQVNLSQRFTAPLIAAPDDIYARLRDRTPAAYGAFLDYGPFALLSNSPELFFHVDALPGGERKIITRPIKGTRPLATGMEMALRDSVKDQAELNMIIDLERNDLGRVCRTGSVKVTEPRTIERHPTVYHGVATVEGTLRPDVSFVDLLRAVFPGGSITGAPKVRAMQIIEELEPVRRGPYCGAIGYLAADGSMAFNIAIRTILLHEGKAHLSVGGGVVADSNPADEYEETLVKAQAAFAALGLSRADKMRFT